VQSAACCGFNFWRRDWSKCGRTAAEGEEITKVRRGQELSSGRGGEFEEGIEVTVDLYVARDVGAGDAEFAGMGNDAGKGITANDPQRDLVSGRNNRWFDHTFVVRLNAEGKLIVEQRRNKWCDVHYSSSRSFSIAPYHRGNPWSGSTRRYDR
jgi:hypothetical protein